MIAIARDSWTGTRGISSYDLSNDWEEARAASARASRTRAYSATLLMRAWDRIEEYFGSEVRHCDFTDEEVVEWYLDFT